jgi:hypothetical protein
MKNSNTIGKITILLSLILTAGLIPAHAIDIDVEDAPYNGDIQMAIDAAVDGEDNTIQFNLEQVYTTAAPLTIDAANADDITFRADPLLDGDPNLKPWLIIVETTDATAPVFEITGADKTIVFEGITIKGGTIGIDADKDNTVILNRCYITENSDAGVQLTKPKDGSVIVNSSISKNDDKGIEIIPDGLPLDGGDLLIVLSTIKDNTGDGIHFTEGNIDIQACVLVDNGDNIQGPADLTDKGNFIWQGTAVETGSEANPTTTDMALLFQEDDWIGELSLLAAIITPPDYDLPTIPGTYGDTDIEGDDRDDQEVQAGADRTAIALQDTYAWVDVSVDPFIVGKDVTVTIDIVLGSKSFNAASRILIVPEYRGDPLGIIDLDYIELTPTLDGADPSHATGYFTPTDTFYNNLLLDGRAEIYLLLDGELYGITQRTAEINPSIQSNLNFIIDTTPPTIQLQQIGRAVDYIYLDSVAAAPAFISGPTDWRPGFDPTPWSNGQLTIKEVSPQMFFNEPNPLNFHVEIFFYDDSPKVNGVFSNVETAGFPAGTSVTLGTEAAGLMTLRSLLDINGDFVTGGANPIHAIWDYIGGLGSSLTMLPQARDRAGNLLLDANPMILWWMTGPPYAEIVSGAYGGANILDPTFTWQLQRGVAPAQAHPCEPIAQYAIWAAPAGANLDTTAWTQVGVSPWTRDTSITRSSALLDRALTAFSDTGETLLIAFRGADEAGNVQGPNFDDPSMGILNSVADLGTAAWDYWSVPGEDPIVDTDVQARFWYNKLGGYNYELPYLRQRDINEVDFGASTQIPLPPLDTPYERVEAEFTVTVNNIQPNYTVLFQIFEEGRVVARGTLYSKDTNVLKLQIPEDLLNPVGSQFTITQLNDLDGDGNDDIFPCDFLNLAPNDFVPANDANCLRDRLGDEGDPDDDYRKRSIDYTVLGWWICHGHVE